MLSHSSIVTAQAWTTTCLLCLILVKSKFAKCFKLVNVEFVDYVGRQPLELGERRKSADTLSPPHSLHAMTATVALNYLVIAVMAVADCMRGGRDG